MPCIPAKTASIHRPTAIETETHRTSILPTKPTPGQGCTHNTGVILEVEEDTICALPWLRLADNDRGHDLLPQLRLSLLDGRHDHVTDTTGRETVKTRSDTLDGDDVQVTSTRVVAAVHDGAAVFALVPLYLPSHHQPSNPSRYRSSILGPSGMGFEGSTYTGRPRVIFSLPPGAPRL